MKSKFFKISVFISAALILIDMIHYQIMKKEEAKRKEEKEQRAEAECEYKIESTV